MVCHHKQKYLLLLCWYYVDLWHVTVDGWGSLQALYCFNNRWSLLCHRRARTLSYIKSSIFSRWFRKCRKYSLKFLANIFIPTTFFFLHPTVLGTMLVQLRLRYCLIIETSVRKYIASWGLLTTKFESRLKTLIFTRIYNHYFWRQIFDVFIYHGYRWWKRRNKNGAYMNDILAFFYLL